MTEEWDLEDEETDSSTKIVLSSEITQLLRLKISELISLKQAVKSWVMR